VIIAEFNKKWSSQTKRFLPVMVQSQNFNLQNFGQADDYSQLRF